MCLLFQVVPEKGILKGYVKNLKGAEDKGNLWIDSVIEKKIDFVRHAMFV